MRIFKGFAQIGGLVNNNAGIVAPVGELSTWSMTYTRDKSQHVHSEFPNLTLVGFSYYDNQVPGVIPDLDAYECLYLIDWVYSKSRSGAITNGVEAFKQLFIAELTGRFTYLDSGLNIYSEPYWTPEYVEFSKAGEEADHRWKIWFSDQSFRNQFDETTILVVPPVENVDSLIEDYDTVSQLFTGADIISDVLQRAITVAGGNPYTRQSADNYYWHDRITPTLKISVPWTVVIYGIAGDNPDAKKQAIQDYILENSNYTRDTWAVIFPDIFTSTEFIITPFWNDYSVPNAARETGQYSGVKNVVSALDLCVKTCKGTGYTPGHIQAHLTIMSSLYKSLTLGAVGGPENRGGVDDFYERYPDYMNVPTTHIDFQKMDEGTRNFVLLLTEMLMHAESLTAVSTVPNGFSRIVRDGVIYLAKTYENFLYLVVSKPTVEALE